MVAQNTFRMKFSQKTRDLECFEDMFITGCMGFPCSGLISNGSLRHCLFLKTPGFRLGKIHIPWVLLCCDRFPLCSVHRPAKVCILQSHLRTRRCVGFWISSHPAFGFPRTYENPPTFGCNRTFCGWGTCRNMRRHVHRCRFRFCHIFSSPSCSCIISPSFWCSLASYQAGILSAQVELKWLMLNRYRRLFHSSREIASGQNVCELMFGISVSNLNFRIKIHSVKQPIQSNSVGSWHVFHCWTSAFDYHLSHGFVILKDIQHSIGTRMCFRLMERDQRWSDRDWCSWLASVFACLVEELPTSFTVALLHLWFLCVFCQRARLLSWRRHRNNCLSVVHMEEGVQARVQVEVEREEQCEGETHGELCIPMILT